MLLWVYDYTIARDACDSISSTIRLSIVFGGCPSCLRLAADLSQKKLPDRRDLWLLLGCRFTDAGFGVTSGAT